MSALALPALAMLQRSLASPAALYGDLAASRPDGAVGLLQSTGYWTGGIGAGRYIADALADEGLLAAHPRFVFKTANGRIFRLMAEAGAITAEQGGAHGDGIANDQPALQAAIDYAHKIGAGELRLTRGTYRLHCPVRSAPSYDRDAQDGHPLVVRASIALRGCAAVRSVLDFRGVDGADPEATWQVVPTSAANPAPALWRGGGIYLAGDRSNPAPAPRSIARFELDRVELRGNRRRLGSSNVPADPATGDGWDVTDKALWLQNCYVGQIVCRDTDMVGWRGEIFYLGGSADALETLELHRCRFRTSVGSAFNPGVTCEVLAVDCEFGDAAQAQEDTGKRRARYRNCTWHDCDHTGIGSGPTNGFLYNYAYPTRSDTSALPETVLEGCLFRDVGTLRVASWTRGNITAIDSTVAIDGEMGFELRDIDLSIDSWVDRRSGFNAVSFNGVQSLTSQVSGAPAGTYKKPPRNVKLRVRVHRSDLAVANDRHSYGVQWLYYLDQSCRIAVSGSHAHARSPNGGETPLSFPLVSWEGGEASSAYVPHGWYTKAALAASGTLVPSGPVQAVGVSSAISVAMTLPSAPTAGAAYGYAEGQKARFAKSDAQGSIVFTKGAAASMAMTATRTLANADDWIEFTYNGTRRRWEETGFFSTV